MSILFLDFDGVMHRFGVVEAAAFTQMEVFERLMEHLPDTQIVLSTTWRQSHGLDVCKAFFPAHLQSRIVDATPLRVEEDDLPSQLWPYVREAQCWYWMRQNRPPYTRWLALDDEPWRFSPFCTKLYLTDGKTGLVERDIPRIIQFMEAETSVSSV